MEYNIAPLEKRMKENIKNYNLDDLFRQEVLHKNLELLQKTFQMDICFTDRHGVPYMILGESYQGFKPDVVAEPGLKFRVCDRTLGHIYYKLDRTPETMQELAKEALQQVCQLCTEYGESHYINNEYAQYLDYLEEVLQKQNLESSRPEQRDILTGTLTKTYFEKRMRLIDRAEIAPVALIEANINDWKYVFDRYGAEHSDRLIATIAGYLRQEARSEYIIGRYDGDVFLIMIPMPEEEEAEAYCARVQERCLVCDDELLAPSVAFGIAMKLNVEQKMEDLISDAEYEMLAHKLEMKSAAGYYERLHKNA